MIKANATVFLPESFRDFTPANKKIAKNWHDYLCWQRKKL